MLGLDASFLAVARCQSVDVSTTVNECSTLMSVDFEIDEDAGPPASERRPPNEKETTTDVKETINLPKL